MSTKKHNKRSSRTFHLTPMLDSELSRSYNTLTSEQIRLVNDAYAIFTRRVKDSSSANIKKSEFNNLFSGFNNDQIILFLDRNYFVIFYDYTKQNEFLEYLTPDNFIKTFFIDRDIIELIKAKTEKVQPQRYLTYREEDKLKNMFIRILRTHLNYYEQHRTTNKFYAMLTEKDPTKIDNFLCKKNDLLLPCSGVSPTFFEGNHSPDKFAIPEKVARKNNPSRLKTITTYRKNLKPELYYCIPQQGKKKKLPLHKIENNKKQIFEELLLCEKNPINKSVSNISKNIDRRAAEIFKNIDRRATNISNKISRRRTAGGCATCGGIITGGQKKQQYPVLNMRNPRTLNRRVIGKKRQTLRRVKNRGGCPCNQTGGFVYSKLQTKKGGSTLLQTIQPNYKQTNKMYI
jgi:hypothetical protein